MSDSPHSVIVGTSGHIDHGKTALVRALTGTDTDRWEEEKRRGITIDLGFASLEIEPGRQLGFVDVPGHERFVKNMLAGAGGIDLVLLVIAADESVMPQTREHFEICRLLGIQHGIIVLTKVDLVDTELLELVKLEVAEYVTDSFLEKAPVLAVSSTSGEGIPELRSCLAQATRTIKPRNQAKLLRLPIDRVFTMKGFGTVVTGTLTDGILAKDSNVEILPGGLKARVRNIQVHGSKTTEAIAGQRTAVNLSSIDKASLCRGQSIVLPGSLESTTQFDAWIELLKGAKPLKHGAPVHVHLATAETVGHAYLLDRSANGKAMRPGSKAYVQLRLENPLPALHGDRFILRQFSPLVTIAGGTVLEPQAPRHKQKDAWQPLLHALHTGTDSQALEIRCANQPNGVSGSELIARTGRPVADWLTIAAECPNVLAIRADPLWLVHKDRMREACTRMLDALTQFHKQNPLLSGAPLEAIRSSEFGKVPEFLIDEFLRKLQAAGKIVLDNELIRLAAFRIQMQAEEQEAHDKLLAAFQKAGLQVPALKEFLPMLPIDTARSRRILSALLRSGVLVRVSNELVFHQDAIRQLREQVTALRGQSISVPDFKTMSGVSRKYAIPLLEHFDKQKITARVGNMRRVL